MPRPSTPPLAPGLALAATLLAAALSLIVPTSAHAEATSWFTWSTCAEPASNLAYTSQASARQVISMEGLSGNPGGFFMVVSLGSIHSNVSYAWLCAIGQTGPGFAPVPGIVPARASTCADVVPGLQVSGAPIPCVTPDGCLAGWSIQGTFPPGTNLDPARRYALVELDYDFSRVTPALCPGGTVDPPQCFGLIMNSLASGPYFAQPAWLLSWNRPDGSADACAQVVPTRRGTWGELKSRYR